MGGLNPRQPMRSFSQLAHSMEGVDASDAPFAPPEEQIVWELLLRSGLHQKLPVRSGSAVLASLTSEGKRVSHCHSMAKHLGAASNGQSDANHP